jgi:hypothetical protein
MKDVNEWFLSLQQSVELVKHRHYMMNEVKIEQGLWVIDSSQEMLFPGSTPAILKA